jgi:nucleoside-diphosphate-sugar epimerase
MSESFLV